MRVLVCGTRTFGSHAMHIGQMHLALRRLLDQDKLVIIHGGCRGADQMADAWCQDHEVHQVVYRADWDTHGRKAGPIRNSEMLESGVDLVVAFWDLKSRGTKDTIDKARAKGIPVEVWHHGASVATLPSGTATDGGER